MLNDLIIKSGNFLLQDAAAGSFYLLSDHSDKFLNHIEG
jgi:hypothetical protein